MSDESRRELERRWMETGSAEDEARLLAERLRVGDLSYESLELAGYCEHPAALSVLGEEKRQALSSRARVLASSFAAEYTSPRYHYSDTELWVLGLAHWGIVAAGHAVCAVATLALPLWTRDFPEDARPLRALHVLPGWLKSAAAGAIDLTGDARKEVIGARDDSLNAAYDLRDKKQFRLARQAARAVAEAVDFALCASRDTRKAHSAAGTTVNWGLSAGIDETVLRRSIMRAVALYALSSPAARASP